MHHSPFTTKKMFTIRAAYSDKFEIKTSLEKAHAFFLDLKNFIEIMPNIESIHTDGKGVTRWSIRDDIPLLGTMRQTFPVTLSENSRERIEWTPFAVETQNFLRYSADFIEKDAETTLVQISQSVEMRVNFIRLPVSQVKKPSRAECSGASPK
jgi:carbon monoxide dehydrogenase subunit G